MQSELRIGIISLSDAATTLLPADSQLKQLAGKRGAAASEEKVAVLQGDVTLDHLLLDYDDISVLTEEGVYTLVVQGNLNARYIYNESTDGAVHLVVLGNVQAENMAVGGQLIYVQGNLQVNDLLWGDYNHGDLYVKGDAGGKVLLLTDEYHFRVDGATVFRETIDGARGDVHLDFQLHHTFIPDVLYEPALNDENGRYHLIRQSAAGYWQQGRSILQQLPALTFPFGDGAINEANIRRLAASVVMPFNDNKYEYWLDDLFLRVVKAHPGNEHACSVYMEKKQQYAVWIQLREEAGRIEVAARMMADQDTKWYYLDESAPQHFHLLLRNGWQALLYSITEYEYHWSRLQEAVTVEKAEALLALPVTRRFPFYSSANYFWHGDYAYQFRHADDEHNGETYPPQLIIYWEHPVLADDYESFTFRIETNERGERAVLPIYRESEAKPSLYIDFTEISQVHKAIWLFRRIEAVLPRV
jgi:hypothetical protein